MTVLFREIFSGAAAILAQTFLSMLNPTSIYKRMMFKVMCKACLCVGEYTKRVSFHTTFSAKVEIIT